MTASSEWRYDDFNPVDEVTAENLIGNVFFAWPETLRAVRVPVHNLTARDQPLRLQVAHAHEGEPEILPRPADEDADFFHHLFKFDDRISVMEPLSEATATVPGGFSGWLDIPLAQPLTLPLRSRSYRHQGLAVLLEGESLRFGLDPSHCDVAQTMQSPNGEISVSEGRLGLLLDQSVPLGEAVSVTNGLNRRWGRAPLNMWVSKPGAPLPQWLELRWPEPQAISRVALTFDAIGRKYTDMPFNNGARAFGPMIRDYKLEVEVGQGWRELLTVKDNYHRFRVHEFAPLMATALRLTVHAAHDPAQPARVVEVRIESPSSG